jgi:hypothetical protein
LCGVRVNEVELWRYGGYEVWAESRFYNGVFDHNTYLVRDTKSVGVSVIEYDADRSRRILYVLYQEPDEDVAAKWKTIISNAKSYRWAEQQADVDKGKFPNWPRSLYYWNGTNSNTFVREMVRNAGLTMVEAPGGWAAGDYKPQQNRISNLSFLAADPYWFTISIPWDSSNADPPQPPRR